MARRKESCRPKWDGRRLTWCGRIAKEFRRNAPDQMWVLDEFESRRRKWPKQIDFAPITAAHGNEGHRAWKWITDTVRNLNRGLKFIRFHQDSKGQIIRWEALESPIDP
jgi:hypothetical protein